MQTLASESQGIVTCWRGSGTPRLVMHVQNHAHTTPNQHIAPSFWSCTHTYALNPRTVDRRRLMAAARRPTSTDGWSFTIVASDIPLGFSSHSWMILSSRPIASTASCFRTTLLPEAMDIDIYLIRVFWLGTRKIPIATKQAVWSLRSEWEITILTSSYLRWSMKKASTTWLLGRESSLRDRRGQSVSLQFLTCFPAFSCPKLTDKWFYHLATSLSFGQWQRASIKRENREQRRWVLQGSLSTQRGISSRNDQENQNLQIVCNPQTV